MEPPKGKVARGTQLPEKKGSRQNSGR